IHFKVLAKVLLVAYVDALEAKLGCDKLKEIQPLKSVQFGFCFGFKGSGSVSYLICSCCDERSCNEGKKLHFHVSKSALPLLLPIHVDLKSSLCSFGYHMSSHGRGNFPNHKEPHKDVAVSLQWMTSSIRILKVLVPHACDD
ncbi:hypothetical protein LINPERHAP1_LOCUS35291, partial [Linum perenne]